MKETAVSGQNPQTKETKIAGITYMVTVTQSKNASESLKEKLKKLILASARMEREELSEK